MLLSKSAEYYSSILMLIEKDELSVYSFFDDTLLLCDSTTESSQIMADWFILSTTVSHTSHVGEVLDHSQCLALTACSICCRCFGQNISAGKKFYDSGCSPDY